MDKKIKKSSHHGELDLNGFKISCAVLEDGTRILVNRSLANALGVKGAGAYWRRKQKKEGALLPEYLSAKYLAPFISEELYVNISNPIRYINYQGILSEGISAELLADICDIYINAGKKGAFANSQEVASVAYKILLAFSKIGIIALVDEATGYQYERERFELQKILHAYVSDEILKWQLTFTDDFYKEVYRLWGLPFIPKYIRIKPSFIGKLTRKYIYELLPNGVVSKIKENTGRTEKGNWKYKWHQSLTPEVGREHLKKQIIEVTTLMSISPSKEHFDGLFQQKYNKQPVQLLLEFQENYQESKFKGIPKELDAIIGETFKPISD